MPSSTACGVGANVRMLPTDFPTFPTDLVVAQEASDVESSSRLDFLLLHEDLQRRRFVA